MGKKIEVYTDGSCLKNPGIGGFAYCILLEEEKIIFSARIQDTTNNRMELEAVIHAIQKINEMNLQNEQIIIYSDSIYVVNGYNIWSNKWKINNWNNNKVLNIDLWKKLLKLKKKNISMQWVKAHSDNYYNNLVDKIAREKALDIEKEN